MDGSIESYLLLGFVLSVLGSLGGIAVVGIVLIKLPADYFGDSSSRKPLLKTNPLVRWAGFFLKNFFGAALVTLGLIMSVPGIPGPGIMTIVIGLMMLDFEKKRQWARWVMRRPPILRAANGLRRMYGKPPFVLPPRASRYHRTIH